MFEYTTHKDYTVRCKSHLATKNHRGQGKRVHSEVMSIRPLSNSLAKNTPPFFFFFFLNKTSEICHQENKLIELFLFGRSKPHWSDFLQLEFEACLINGGYLRETKRHCPISHHWCYHCCLHDPKARVVAL